MTGLAVLGRSRKLAVLVAPLAAHIDVGTGQRKSGSEVVEGLGSAGEGRRCCQRRDEQGEQQADRYEEALARQRHFPKLRYLPPGRRVRAGIQASVWTENLNSSGKKKV